MARIFCSLKSMRCRQESEVFFDISLPIQKEDTDFTIFQRFLLMHPDDLPVQIERFHTVSGNTNTKICIQRHFITHFHFGKTVRVQKLSGSCRYWKIIEVECTSGKLIDNGFFTESISVLKSQNLPIFVK